MHPEVIGKYRILRLIGQGGMASVYEAEHETLGSKAAIKVLNPLMSSDDRIRERFRKEARYMASLSHPNIAKVFDFDEQPERLSIVMELLEGEDLSRYVKRSGPLNRTQLTDIFMQVLNGLQYAHEKKVMHCDIKPSNILIQPDGKVKIIDFGIANVYGTREEMTMSGYQMGTPVYMSPEQVRSDKTIDHRSDIYSLGVAMFYAVSVTAPYNAETDSQYDIFNKIVLEEIPEIPGNPMASAMVSRACQKERGLRYQNCWEWMLDLKGFSFSKNPESASIIYGNPVKDEGSTVDIPKSDESKNEKNLVKKERHTRLSKFQWRKVLWISLFLLTGVIGVSLLWKMDYSTIDKHKASSKEPFGTVTIGQQVWMAANLDVDTFRNGDRITQAKSELELERLSADKLPAWCFYLFDESLGKRYGRLYNYHAVMDPRRLTPKGWHVPELSDWRKLADYLGGDSVAGKKLKQTDEWIKNDDSKIRIAEPLGFKALPGGRSINGYFDNLGLYGNWWSNNGGFVYLSYDNDELVIAKNWVTIENNGFISVRCIRVSDINDSLMTVHLKSMAQDITRKSRAVADSKGNVIVTDVYIKTLVTKKSGSSKEVRDPSKQPKSRRLKTVD